MSQDYFLEAFGAADAAPDFDPGVMDTPDVVPQQVSEEVHAPAPVMAVGSWSWTPSAMLWTAGGVLMVGFTIWFLMSFNAAKARALAEEVTENE